MEASTDHLVNHFTVMVDLKLVAFIDFNLPDLHIVPSWTKPEAHLHVVSQMELATPAQSLSDAHGAPIPGKKKAKVMS